MNGTTFFASHSPLQRWMKPRLKRLAPSLWFCEGRGAGGHGSTPSAAYRMWEANTRPPDAFYPQERPRRADDPSSPWYQPYRLGDPMINPYVVTCGSH